MMNRFLVTLVVLTCTTALLAQEPGEKVALHLEQAGFEEYVIAVEKQTGHRFYFDHEWVKGITVSLETDSMLIESSLKKVLSGSGLNYSFIAPDRWIILHRGKVSSDISHLTGSEREATKDKAAGQAGILHQSMEVIKPEQIVQTIVVGSGEGNNSRSVARISGQIRNVESGESVMGATMVVVETGKGGVSDANGIISMSLEPGRYNVQFSFIGLETFHCQLDVLSDGRFQVDLHPAVIALDEVQIVGSHYRAINSTDVGVEHLSMKSVKQRPLFMGENDIINISRLLPGITSTSETSAGVNVRGGSADQNIFYINRVPVYNTSHMFGFLSAFNSEIIRDFSVYKGNVPVNYGGRISSVFDIHSRNGNMKTLTAHAGISPVSAHLTLDAPLKKEKVSFLVSGRTSYSDWMLNKLEDPLLRESDANFYDLAASIHAIPGEKDQISAFYYQSHDRFAYGDLANYEYGNLGGSLQWNHTYSPAFSSSVTLALSEYSFAHVEEQEVSLAYSHSYRLMHNELVAEFSWVPALNHHLSFGVDLIDYSLDRGKVKPYGPESLKTPLNLGEENGIEGSLFFSDDFTLFPWLSIYTGLRYSMFAHMGPDDVLIYEDGLPKTEGSVTDTISFGKNEAEKIESGPEFRIALNFKARQNTSFKLSFSQMRQYLFMLTNTVTISPTDQWKLADYHISPPTGEQYTAGVYHIWPRVGLSGSVELYYKHTNNVVEFRDGADFLGSPHTERLILQGEQNAYGAEFMLQRNSGRLFGWVSYAYSRSMIQVDSENSLETINRGDPYPSSYDRPHVLNLVWSYRFNRRFTFSNNLVYMSGRPVTYPSSLYYMDDYVFIDYYSKNQVRIPDYFRLDASITIEGNLRADKKLHSTWSFNVYNLLGTNNPQSIFFEPELNFLKGYSFSVIGIPIFTVSWNVKLGNYESN